MFGSCWMPPKSSFDFNNVRDLSRVAELLYFILISNMQISTEFEVKLVLNKTELPQAQPIALIQSELIK